MNLDFNNLNSQEVSVIVYLWTHKQKQKCKQQNFISFLKEQCFRPEQPAVSVANRGGLSEIRTKINIAPSNMTERKTYYMDFVIQTVS